MTIAPRTRLKASVLPSADFFTFQPLTPEDGLPMMAVVDSANTKGCVRFSGSATSTVVPVLKCASVTPLYALTVPPPSVNVPGL